MNYYNRLFDLLLEKKLDEIGDTPRGRAFIRGALAKRIRQVRDISRTLKKNPTVPGVKQGDPGLPYDVGSQMYKVRAYLKGAEAGQQVVQTTLADPEVQKDPETVAGVKDLAPHVIGAGGRGAYGQAKKETGNLPRGKGGPVGQRLRRVWRRVYRATADPKVG